MLRKLETYKSFNSFRLADYPAVFFLYKEASLEKKGDPK